MARRYEFYFRVAKTIFYERAQRVSKILFLPRENKIHIFKPPCNVLFTRMGSNPRYKLGRVSFFFLFFFRHGSRKL